MYHFVAKGRFIHGTDLDSLAKCVLYRTCTW